ncbi:MAG: mammalian cell entry protein [Mycobacterium sp.]|nr:mammalian cell entry protein [Mycobacterium sp.]
MRRRALIAGVVLVAILAVVCGWSGYLVYQDRAAEKSRELFIETGKRVAVDVTTIDHLYAESDVRRVLDSATGTFRDDFAGRSAALIDVVKRTRSTSVGTVTEAGLESLSGNEGRVLVSIAVTTDTFGIAEKQPRYWRMRLTLVRDEDSAKVSKLDFVS